jgi:hypothetical protein
MSNATTSYSQASQDLFVLYSCMHKRKGTFVEIGTNHPTFNNNTYLLENVYDWGGILIDNDSSFEVLYPIYRPKSSYIIADASSIDYKSLLQKSNMPKKIDYLQIDLNVDNRSTLTTLELLDEQVLDTYTFGTLTMEHDIYTGDHFNTRERSRTLLKKRGYILAFPDVTVFWNGQRNPFEDWYMHPSIIDINMIDNVKVSESLFHEDVIAVLERNKLFQK